MSLRVRDHAVEAQAHFAQGGLTLRTAEGTVTWDARPAGASLWVLSRDGTDVRAFVARDKAGTWVHVLGRAWLVQAAAGGGSAAGGAADGTVRAPMTGRVLEVLAAEGDAVEAGQRLLVISAMKMRLEITAPVAGTLRKLAAAAGAQVEGSDVLAVIEP
jgi:biotin carboxyl carrier protein